MDGVVVAEGVEVVKWSGEPKAWVKTVYPPFSFHLGLWLAISKA